MSAACRTIFVKPGIPLLDEKGFIRNEAYEDEYTLDEYADKTVVGDPHTVAEKMIADIKRLNPEQLHMQFLVRLHASGTRSQVDRALQEGSRTADRKGTGPALQPRYRERASEEGELD